MVDIQPMTLSFIRNDSNTWITEFDNRTFMIHEYCHESYNLYWTNEVGKISKKVITSLYYSGKTWKNVEDHILGYCEKNK